MPRYRYMNTKKAMAIANGREEAFDEDEVLRAWQHLVRTGTIKKMSDAVQTQAVRLQRGALIT